jgi:pimeloyl-ACP methyl ester carboxylesterase
MPPLILLHGFTGAPRSWIAVLECLGPERDVAVLALAGHVGRSVRGTLGSLRPVLASTAAESAAQAPRSLTL